MTRYELYLNDSDVDYLDNVSNDIKIKRSLIPFDNVTSEDSFVIIQFEEDPETIQHEYEIVAVDNETVKLKWLHKLEESLLTEADFFKNIKNKLNPDQETKLNKAQKAADKQDKKFDKKVTELYIREIEEGRDWKFYIQLPNQTYPKNPLSYNEVRSLYKGNRLPVFVVNAIVTTGLNYLVRAGKKDFHERGVIYPNDKFNGIYDKWTNSDKTLFVEFVKSLPENSPFVKEVINKFSNELFNRDTVKSNAETGETKKESSTSITANLIEKVRQLALATGLQIIPKNSNNPVSLKSANKFKQVTPETITNYNIIVNNKKYNLKDWMNAMIQKKLLSESVELNEDITKTILTESPVIKFDDSHINNPSDINLKKIAKDAADKEAADAARAEEEKKIAELKDKNKPIYDDLQHVATENTVVDTLEFLFEKLVPSSGAAETVAGEYVRAMMRILYRDYNDGDKFFTGYGIETCGSSAEWLHDNGLLEEIENIIEDAYRLEDDDKYTDALVDLASSVIQYLLNHEELFYTINTEDSRDNTTEYIEEHQPRYEFECYGSDDIVTLVENGALSSWDLVSYVENVLSYESVYEGAECSRPWGHHDTSVTVENLTKEGYDYLSDSFERNVDDFWQELVDEHADELDTEDDDYDDYDEDEYEKNMQESYEEEERVFTKSDGSYLVRASSGRGYTAFKNGVCIGGVTTNDEKEAINKFISNKLD